MRHSIFCKSLYCQELPTPQAKLDRAREQCCLYCRYCRTHAWLAKPYPACLGRRRLACSTAAKAKRRGKGNCYLSVCAAASFSAGVFCFQHLTALSVELVSTWSLSQTAWEAVSRNMTPLKIDKQVRTHPWLSLLLKSQVELPRSSPECVPQRLQLRGVFSVTSANVS